MSVVVAGVGMIPFVTPSRTETYDVMRERAIRAALADAGIGLESVGAVYAGYVYADTAAGQTAVYGVGTTGVTISAIDT